VPTYYIHGRNKEKAQKAVDEVIAASGNKNIGSFSLPTYPNKKKCAGWPMR
jgi:hypothetical protein